MEHVLEEFLEDYNASTTTPMKLVLFQDAMDHICRINRILRQPRGNALLLGMGGSGDVEKMFRTIVHEVLLSLLVKFSYIIISSISLRQPTHADCVEGRNRGNDSCSATIVKGVERLLSERKLLERSIKYRETRLAWKSLRDTLRYSLAFYT